MERARPGQYEYQVEAELMHEFLRHGAQAVAYSSIVASGPNACVLHYRDNNRADAGRRPAADRRRLRVPGLRVRHHAHVPGQRHASAGRRSDVYELVLAAQLACLDAVQPGAEFHDYHKVAERVLAQGFIDLGLCKGTLDEVLENGAYKQFYMHRAGHWLGMDVHDAGLYQVKGASQRLVPGMVLTVEPGAYIRPADNVPEAFWNIGVRIEDDVLVTADGIENLTAATPEDGRRRRSGLPALTRVRALARRRDRSRPDACTTSSIVGAGPVGATLALALADADLDVVALDARARGRASRAATARSRCRTARA